MCEKTAKEILTKLHMNSTYPAYVSPHFKLFDENEANEVTNIGSKMLGDIIKSAKERGYEITLINSETDMDDGIELQTEIENISINIWDDYIDREETYLYIESEANIDEQKECLEFICEKLQTLPDEDLHFEVKFYDSKLKYPQLVGTEHEWCLFQRWEIRINNLSHDRLYNLVTDLEQMELEYKNKKFLFYSES